jgi:hypothetical protein
MNTTTATPTASPRVIRAAEVMSQNLQKRLRLERTFKESCPERQSLFLNEHTPERKLPLARLLIEAIDNQLVEWLRAKNNGCWESLWAAFTADTGFQLPKTQKGIEAALQAWAGEEKYTAAVAAAESAREARRRAEEAKHQDWRKESLTLQARSITVQSNGQMFDGATFIDTRLAEGWRVENLSRTRIPAYSLVKDNTRIALGRLGLSAYARMKESELTTA